MKSYRIVEVRYPNLPSIYQVQIRNFLGIWMFLGRYTDKRFFTSLNNFQTSFPSFEEAYKRIEDHNTYYKRIRDHINSKRVVLKKLEI